MDSIASPGVHAHELLGVPQGFLVGHSLALCAAVTEDEALSCTQQSHCQINSQHQLEKIFQQVLNPGVGFQDPFISGDEAGVN